MSGAVSSEHKKSDGRRLNLAAIQMDVNPAPTTDRLARAQRLVVDAVEAGAQLIVLPECFNTGYTFSDENHARVETIDGPTASWMGDTAARLNIHLAGSLMLLDKGETYNSLLLYAPDGRMWRYDKNYPWGWERGYFHESCQEPNVTIADTELGHIGMLICWDAAHLNLWRSYAGQVDLMLLSSCPVDVGHATYHFPNGDHFTLDDMGSRVASTVDSALLTFGDMINQQTAWLGVPAVQAIECGHIRTDIPMARRALMTFVFTAPWLLKYLPQANGMQMSCDLVHKCKIVDGNGEILARLSKEDGEAYAIAEVQLAPSRTPPQMPQPASLVPNMSYFLVDRLLPAIVKPVYRRGQRLWRTA